MAKTIAGHDSCVAAVRWRPRELALAWMMREGGVDDLARVDEHRVVAAVAHQVGVHDVMLHHAASEDDGTCAEPEPWPHATTSPRHPRIITSYHPLRASDTRGHREDGSI